MNETGLGYEPCGRKLTAYKSISELGVLRVVPMRSFMSKFISERVLMAKLLVMVSIRLRPGVFERSVRLSTFGKVLL